MCIVLGGYVGVPMYVLIGYVDACIVLTECLCVHVCMYKEDVFVSMCVLY